MRSFSCGAALASLLLWGCIARAVGAIEAQDTDKRPFRVRDSIELTRIIPFESQRTGRSPSGAAYFSPDERHFVVHVRRGDLQLDANVDTLLLFDWHVVSEYLRAPATNRSEPPVPVALVSKVSHQDWAALDQVQWLSDTEIGFTAQADEGVNQAFVVDIRDRHVAQLTHSKTGVASFAVSGNTLLYYAHVDAPLPVAESAFKRPLYDLLDRRDPTEAPMQLFSATRDGPPATRLDSVPAARLAPGARRLWLSPNGRYALKLAPAVNAPAHWAEYQVPHYELFGYTAQRISDDPTSPDLAFRTRYEVVDLQRRIAWPLMDAPSGFISQNGTPAEVFWLTEERVVLSSAYLPLSGVRASVRRQRARVPAIAEVSLGSGAIQLISWEPVEHSSAAASDEFIPISRIGWDGRDRALSVIRRASAGAPEEARYRRSASGWVQVSTSRAQRDVQPSVDQLQTQNERPKLMASVPECLCSRLVFDPNPGVDRFDFGRAEKISWRDDNGTNWTGGIVYPVSYTHGKRYPLVVQTHGFDAGEFLIDGPGGITTAMAAQPLASAGFVVLQIEDNRSATSVDESEAGRYVEGYRAGIQKLIADGIADPDRVGLIAFSRTGLYAIKLMAEYPELLAAVDIADGGWWGYLVDLMLVNYPPDAAEQIRRLSGGSPTAAGLAQWMASNPLYKLPAARAAIRLEANGPSSLIGIWEHFSLLRNAARPVDLVYFPRGSHVLQKPAERLASQGGALDWFRFWLLGIEGSDPGRQQQFSHWRSMREQAAAPH